MTENRLAQFEEKFSAFQEKRILLYGVGENAKAIVERYDDSYRLIGLLSFNHAPSILYGKHTFGIEDLEGLAPDLVIVTEMDQKCSKLLASSGNIPVYDLNGSRLNHETAEDDGLAGRNEKNSSGQGSGKRQYPCPQKRNGRTDRFTEK
ncbi:MAG: hypothetical protein IKS69_01300 [Erysipelotrichaceae bacterium]|nr:hypothetical protein [Erysipelotrichaceae bacterium]